MTVQEGERVVRCEGFEKEGEGGSEGSISPNLPTFVCALGTVHVVDCMHLHRLGKMAGLGCKIHKHNR